MLNLIPHATKIDRSADGSPVVQTAFGSEVLYQYGLVFPVTVSSARLVKGDGEQLPIKSKTVMALLDTGCTVTSIDKRLAAELGLQVIGRSQFMTATGESVSDNYIADITFPGNVLRPFLFHNIGSCELKYDASSKIGDMTRFGLLIGRDVMTRWHITWNGTVSTVCVSD